MVLGYLIYYVTDQIDVKRKYLGVFLDLAKAFDTVSINMLVNKLYHIGTRGSALMIFKDFLFERIQQLKVCVYASTDASVIFGVPQGSVLGPCLLIIYVCTFWSESFTNGKLFRYVDDTALVFHGKAWNLPKCRVRTS